MPSLTTILLAVSVLAPLGTWGWMKAENHFAIRAAVADARRDEQSICKAQITKIGEDINHAAEKRIQAALEEANKIAALPADEPGLERLCHADRACRSRPD